MREYDTAWNEDPNMPFSARQLLDSPSRMPFIDSAELGDKKVQFTQGGAPGIRHVGPFDGQTMTRGGGSRGGGNNGGAAGATATGTRRPGEGGAVANISEGRRCCETPTLSMRYGVLSPCIICPPSRTTCWSPSLVRFQTKSEAILFRP